MWIGVNQSTAKQANVCAHVDDFYINIFGHIDQKYFYIHINTSDLLWLNIISTIYGEFQFILQKKKKLNLFCRRFHVLLFICVWVLLVILVLVV